MRLGRGGGTMKVLGTDVPDWLRYRGIVIQGGQGSGKTVTLCRLLEPAIAAAADPALNHRVIVVDVKGNLTPAVLALARAQPVPVPVYLCNPFDTLSAAPVVSDFCGDPTQIVRL